MFHKIISRIQINFFARLPGCQLARLPLCPKFSVLIVASLITTACQSLLPVSKLVMTTETKPRVLLVGLDGIGFDTFKKFQDGGHFRWFRSAAPMVATFPSISDPNWSRLLRVPVEESYTKEHFSLKSGQVVGSLVDQVQKPPAYENVFDFKPEGFIEHLASLAWSQTTSVYWLDALERDFSKSDPTKDYLAFILNTDLIAHTKGEMPIFEFLKLLESRLEKIKKEFELKHRRELEIILVSDHGNAYFDPKPIFPKEPLEQKGWSVGEKVEGARDVAYVFPEILSFAAMYCKSEMKIQLAKDVSQIDGIHSAFYSSKINEVDFVTSDSQAQALVDPVKKRISYKVIKGQDPFDHSKYFKNGQSISWQSYFDSTLNTPYPNALVRAWEALHLNSKEPASVLVNPKLGYVFANKTLHVLTKFFGLRSVHGSFHQNESVGIAVSTHRDFSPMTPDGFMKGVQLKR